MLNTIAILITAAALFSYLNQRFIRLPTTIGLMVIALGLSVALVLIGALGWPALRLEAETFLSGIDFHETLMQGMLSFLLFAGALHVNLSDLREQKWIIGLLATLGVVISTFLIGGFTYWLMNLLGLNLPLIYCLVFGALISPTDPIAVLGILKTTHAPKTLKTKITGESLFNDGVGNRWLCAGVHPAPVRTYRHGGSRAVDRQSWASFRDVRDHSTARGYLLGTGG